MAYKKYFNNKTMYQDEIFDSKKEAQRYFELQMLQKSGEISDLQKQVAFELQPAFKKNGKTIMKMEYISDFTYKNKEGKLIVEDVKPSKTFKTKEYMIKKKLFEYRYMDLTINEIYY